VNTSDHDARIAARHCMGDDLRVSASKASDFHASSPPARRRLHQSQSVLEPARARERTLQLAGSRSLPGPTPNARGRVTGVVLELNVGYPEIDMGFPAISGQEPR